METDANPFDFEVKDVDSVSIEMAIEKTRGTTASGMRSRSVQEVYRARLRVRKPRRAVTLIESVDANRVRELATALAESMGVMVADEVGEGEPERAEAVQMRTPLAARGAMEEMSIPDQPEPRAWDLEVDPEGLVIRLAWARRGGARVIGCFLVLLTLIGLIATAIAIGVWLPGQTFNGRPMTPGLAGALSAPGLLALVVVPWAWLSLVRGYRVVTIDPRFVRSAWDYPGRGLVARVPGVSALLARGEAVPTAEVESVKTLNGEDGRVVEVRAGGKRVRIGQISEHEEDERDSLVWVAKVVRTGVRALGADA